ncbi:MAG TPA: hypothetical protein VLX61_17755 [Anaerolineales bacterium]|nr:hypothetical protein [Anaerolineales bacterium]
MVAREISEEEAKNSVKELRDLRIQSFEVNREVAHEAARFQIPYRISYCDRHAVALAAVKRGSFADARQRVQSPGRGTKNPIGR